MTEHPDLLPPSNEMVVIHRVFRREFTATPDRVRAVGEGDTERAAVVGDAVELMLLGLHLHHAGEDALLWPKLLSRATPSADAVHRMEAQHENVAALVGKTQAALSRWQAGAASADRDELASTVELLRTAVFEHLDDEEKHILPLIDEHIHGDEWEQLGEHGRRQFPKSKLFIQLGSTLEDATPVERAAFMAKLPAPVRLIWRLVGQRQYERYVSQVRGSAA